MYPKFNGQKKPDTGRYSTSKPLTKKGEKIGDFMEDFFWPQMRSYKWHQFLRKILSKEYLLRERIKALVRNPGSLQEDKDFAEALRLLFNHEIQDTHFGQGNRTLSFEGSDIMYGPPTVAEDQQITELKRMMRTYLCDEKRQDCRVVHANTWFLIKEVRENYGLLRKDTKDCLYQLMDGCAKQYRCGTALLLMAHTSCYFDIPQDRFIGPPNHGKREIDGQGAVTKNCLLRNFRAIKRHGIDNCTEGQHFLSACMIDEAGKRVSFAEACCRLLRDPKRKDGVGVDSESPKYANRFEKKEDQGLRLQGYALWHL